MPPYDEPAGYPGTDFLMPDVAALLDREPWDPDRTGQGRPGCRGARLRRRVFPGRPEQVALARDFARRVLADCPVTDDAVLCVSELATNAIKHTRSGGGTFDVIVWRRPSRVWLAVIDGGADTVPEPSGDPFGISGRGLALVASLSARWKHHGGPAGRIVWCVLEWPTEQPAMTTGDVRTR